MSTKKEYKKTDIGIFPNDWEIKQIGDFNPYVTSGSRGWARFYSTNGFPFLRITNMLRSSIALNLSDLKFVDLPLTEKEGKRTNVQNGDILISITADIGIIGYVDDSISKPAYINQHIALVRFNDTKINSHFFAYFLASKIAQRNFVNSTDSGAKAGMSLTAIKKINILFPPTINEQIKISEALLDCDMLIQCLKQLILKKRNIKEGAVKLLLRPVKSWVKKTISKCFTINSAASKSYSINNNGTFTIMDMGSVSSSGKILHTKKTYDNSDLLEFGDLIMPKDDIGGGNIIGKVAFVDLNDNYVLGDHVYRLRKKSKNIDPLFFYYLINSENINKEFKKKVTGSVQLGIGKKSIEEQEVYFPLSINEQTKLANILFDMDEEITALEIKLQKYDKIKLGMMQNLLTGKIRLI